MVKPNVVRCVGRRRLYLCKPDEHYRLQIFLDRGRPHLELPMLANLELEPQELRRLRTVITKALKA